MNGPRKPEAINLTPGSRYAVTSLGARDEPLVSRGTFRGYTVVGNVDGVCLELDKTHGPLKGKVRVIPSHMILAVDIIEAAKPGPPVQEESVERYYR